MGNPDTTRTEPTSVVGASSAINTDIFTPINFKKWIDERRHLFKPPVGNQQVWHDRDFMITVVGGPNARRDYHINQGEEFFYQLEGNITLRILQAGHPVDIPINEGDIFLLPKNVPHSPQRPANTLGIVIERKRATSEKDGLLWICDHCNSPLYREDFFCGNIVRDLLPVIDRFYKSENVNCKTCGHVHARP
jgi:3-hydroxyanthranilate 3,4-dioxygenase